MHAGIAQYGVYLEICVCCIGLQGHGPLWQHSIVGEADEILMEGGEKSSFFDEALELWDVFFGLNPC